MNWREYQSLQRVAEIGPRFLSYVDQGAGDPVVLLHGFPTWGYLWSGLLPALADRHRVLIPDLMGYGYSDRSDRFDRSLAQQAEWIDRWMEDLGVERAAMVGHDIGGGVALRMAIHHPRRVARLCLLDTVSYDSWPVGPALQLADPESRRRLAAPKLLAALKAFLRRGFSAEPSEALLDGLLAPYSTEVGKLSLIRDAESLDPNHTLELTPHLGRIAAPTLILWGEDDELQPVRWAEQLALDIPEASIFRLPAARHFIQWDRPGEVVQALKLFLEKVPAAATP